MSFDPEAEQELVQQVYQKQTLEQLNVVSDVREANIIGCRVAGIVKWFDPIKGFGFIIPEAGGPDILLHANVLQNAVIGSICQDTKIETKVIRTVRGFQAVEIYTIAPPLTVETDDDQHILSGVDLEDLRPARVKWFNASKGFGFGNVFGECEDIFLSARVLRKYSLAHLQAGEAISLRVEYEKTGPVATMILPWDVSSITN